MKRQGFHLLLFSLFVALNPTEQANILAIFHTASHSHQLLSQQLMIDLAESGHQVTVVSPFPLKKAPKSYRDIELTGLANTFDDFMNTAFDRASTNTPTEVINVLYHVCGPVANFTLWHSNVRKLMEAGEKFDLIYMEAFMNDAFLGFGHYFNAPIIVSATMGMNNWVNDYIGTPAPSSIIPHDLLPFSKEMSFSERLYNIFLHAYDRVYTRLYYHPQQETFYQVAFPDPKPSLDELRRTKVALVLLNTHFSIRFPKALPPNIVEVGGMQINWHPKPLSGEILDFIEQSPTDVIYFSLGTNLKPSRMSKAKLNDIVASLNKTGLRVIWKFDAKIDLDPQKFLLRKWLPQDSILAHPKVKLFITHGGLLSCTESLFHGKPVVGIPAFGDQQSNMDKVNAAGWGVRLDYVNLTENSFDWSLREVLMNEKYAKNAKILSRRFRDQPMTPRETAKFWVEYVIRNGGGDHMKLNTLQMSWIEYNNLDVLGLFLLVLLIPILGLALIVKKLFGSSPKAKLKTK